MDQNIPAVSIVIPVFNVEKYIGKCLDSLISQTLHNIEIICVNDCSTDKSLDILRDYEAKDNRIVVIDLPRNIKQGGARNVGIKKARAPFLGFVDSDDWVSLDMYENLYTLAVTHDAEWYVVTIFSIIVNKIFVYGLTVNLNGFHCLNMKEISVLLKVNVGFGLI